MTRPLLLLSALLLASSGLPAAAQEVPGGTQAFLLMLGDGEVRILASPQEPDWKNHTNRALWVRCRELKFAHPKAGGFTVHCHGNVTAASKSFTAQAGELRILEDHKRLEFHSKGNGQVRLWKRSADASPVSRLSARSIVWWPDQGRLQIEGSSMLEVFDEQPKP